MPVLPFGSFAPDQAAYGHRGLLTAKNVFPSASGYLPVGALSPATDALDARPRGAVNARDRDGNVFQYAGDASKLYQNINGTWTDRSIVGGYSTGTGERWEFAPWKNKMLAVNFTDDPQQLTFGGTAFSDLTTALKARHIATIRDFVVMANTFDGTDGNVPNRVRWSAFNDETDWTVSASTLSDFQDLKTGAVQRVFGGEFGVVLQRESVYRQTFVGAPPVFQFDEVLPGVGLIAPGGAARDGDVVYFLSLRGFVALVNGTQPNLIGANRVDKTVLADLDQNHLDRVSCEVDPATHRVFWAYPGAGNVDGRPNRVWVYDRSLDEWSGPIEDEVELVWSAGGIGLTLEGLDSISGSLDDLPASLDSPIWIGGAATIAAFDDGFRSGAFSGDPMTATLETGDLEIHSGRRTPLQAFRSLVNGGTVTARVGIRNRQSDDISYGSSLSQRPSGRFTCRKNARYHRFEYTLSGSWERAIGMQIEPREAKRGQARG